MPSNDKISPAAAAAITPFDFRLTNRWGQPVLFTRLLQQDLTLELINTSRAELTIEPIAPGKAETVPTAEDSQFHLRFRSGTLWDPKIALEPRSPWKISPAQYPRDTRRSSPPIGPTTWCSTCATTTARAR